MPKIPQQVLSSVFYLYETKADADAGRDPGGTGFILGWTHELPAVPVHYYAVTNWHVAVKEPAPDERPQCPVIRLNTKYGTTQAIDLKPENWHHIQGGIDIAVTPIEFDVRHMDWSFVPSDMVAWESDIENGLVGVGDDVFMVGLFVDHDGEAVNVPSSRFGNISVLPTPLSMIKQETGLEAPAYVVDMHSRSGFSGSPVFIYRTPGQDLSRPIGSQWRVTLDRSRLDRGPLTGDQIRISADIVFKFLGIHFGQFEEEWEANIAKEHGSESGRRGLIKDEARIKGWSGMTTVIPAWEIINVLSNIPELVAMREKKKLGN